MTIDRLVCFIENKYNPYFLLLKGTPKSFSTSFILIKNAFLIRNKILLIFFDGIIFQT